MPQPIIANKSVVTQLKAVERIDANGCRKIVWILPHTSDEHFEYVKRCESCPGFHDGQYGSGRFCSSRCARRVGGLAKKRMWDLAHGSNDNVLVNQDEIRNTAPDSVQGTISSISHSLPPIQHTIPVPPHEKTRLLISRNQKISSLQKSTDHVRCNLDMNYQMALRNFPNGSMSKMSLAFILNPEP